MQMSNGGKDDFKTSPILISSLEKTERHWNLFCNSAIILESTSHAMTFFEHSNKHAVRFPVPGPTW